MKLRINEEESIQLGDSAMGKDHLIWRIATEEGLMG